MTKYIFVSLLVLAGCSTDSLYKACPIDCVGIKGEYTAEEEANLREKMGVGVCHADPDPKCDDNKDVISCNAVLPSMEKCDGLDNDCDGKVDENIYATTSLDFSNRYPDDTNPCRSTMGECAYALAVCDDGWQCDYDANDIVVLDNDAQCDNRDNDCDGDIDEEFYGTGCFGEWPQEEFWRFTQDECRPGVELCVNGQVECVGLREPQEEQCNRKDDDCNGVIDDVPGLFSVLQDVVIILDRSGSMGDKIRAVIDALAAYLDQFTNILSVRFAVVDITATTDTNGDGERNNADLVAKIIDFSPLEDVRNALSQLTSNGSAYEASLDGVKAVCDITGNPLNLSWDNNSNKMFYMFTDEPCQSYTVPPTTQEEAVDMCANNGVLPFIWGSPDAQSMSCFSSITDAGGIYFDVTSDWNDILNDLNSIVVTLCEIF